MNKVFLSYRRKESSDFSGRLFDRTAGYFGPDSVFMDVDVLISGADYRSQIGLIIDRCDVLLAIIGQQWISITNDAGKRRLDNPDDQLRIEIATAFEKGITVIPILIHGATMPAADALPADIAALADLEPVEVQSGQPFNTDVKKLIDRLEQKHGLRHPSRRFPLELILIPTGILLLTVAVFGLFLLPKPHVFVQARLGETMGSPDLDTSLAGYRDSLKTMILYCTIPLGLGPLLIVLGNRWCCLTKESRRERNFFSSGIGGRPAPKSGKSVMCLGLGLASFGLGAIAAVPAIVIGIWALLDVRQRTGWVRGRALVAIGMLAAIGGGTAATVLHISYWRCDVWLQHVEAAETAVAAQDLDEALAACQRSIDADPGNIGAVAVSRILRAEIFSQTEEYSSVVKEMSSVIDSFEPIEQYLGRMLEQDIVRIAYGLRSEAYYALGDKEKGDEDVRRQRDIGMTPVPENGGYLDFDNREAPPAPAVPLDDDESAPYPPAPIVDPSA